MMKFVQSKIVFSRIVTVVIIAVILCSKVIKDNNATEDLERELRLQTSNIFYVWRVIIEALQR